MTHLAVPISRFIGRERDVEELQRRLGETRLLTCVGPGGIGKTRLALEVARRVQDVSSAQVIFVDLAPQADPALVPRAVATALDIPEQPGRPLVDTLTRAFGSESILLILDNCEHLVTACATLADQLLQACAGLRVLATSRERLDIYGETVWHVPPLSVPEENPSPSAEQVGRAEAAQLLIERAQASVPGFVLTETNAPAIERICRQLDGIPLALELAAARLTALSVRQIAERLDDTLKLLVRGSRLAPARQRTLRATLAWSYGMLSPAEQVLFDRLSVFAGGWTLEAAESVCGDLESSGPDEMTGNAERIPRHEVLDLLTKLVEKSLVIAVRSPDGAVHFRTLETLRQFGWERLTERGSVGAVADRHAEFFLALAERAEPELLGHAGSALDRLEQAHDNLRAALRRLLDLGAVERAERLVGALGRFWLLRCYFTEGERWLVRVLQLPGSERPTSARARCLYVLASLALSRGDFAAAEAADQEALTIWRALGDAEGESWVLFGLGQLARLRGEYQLARTLLNEGVKVSRVACQPAAEANCIGMLADLAYDQGDDREALLQGEAELACSTAIGWRAGISNAQRVLGQVRAAQGDHRAAKALLEASLATYRELRARGSTLTLARLSELAMELGDLGAARQWLAESVSLAQYLSERPGIARGLEGCAHLAAVQAQPLLTLRLAAAAAAIRTETGARLPPRERAALDQLLASARTAVGKAAEAREWAEGAALRSEDAVACALTMLRADSGVVASGREQTLSLTSRERQVALLVARGLSNPQIAGELVIGERTAQTHVGNILSKLGLSTRAQIAAWVTEHHLAIGNP